MCEDNVGSRLRDGFAAGGLGREEGALNTVVDYEERSGRGGRAKEDGWEAGVDATERLA